MELNESQLKVESPEHAKDTSIQDVVNFLFQHLGEDAFQVVDHWGADFFAIGIARKDAPETLVYISTWQKPDGRCAATLQSAEEPWRDVSCGAEVDLEDLSFQELLLLVRLHLRLSECES